MDKILKLLGIAWGVLTFVVTVAFFAGGQWEYWKRMRDFIDRAPSAEALQRQTARTVPTALACQQKTVPSQSAVAPTVEALVPSESLAAGFQRVSGGCRVRKAAGGVPAHNGIPIESVPVENGWRCAVGDPAGVSLTTDVEAFVVYCKLQ